MYQQLFRQVRRLCYSHRPPIVFMHVPKTGGTSLEELLERRSWPKFVPNVSFASVTRAHELAEAMRLPGFSDGFGWLNMINASVCYKIAEQAPLIAGHFCVTAELIQASRPPYVFVTLLRDPVDRWISNYVYSRIRGTQTGQRRVPASLTEELETFMASPRARREGAKYVHYLGGFQDIGRLYDRETIEEAKHTLSLFDVVGYLEDLPAFEGHLSAAIGWRTQIPHLRKTSDYVEPGGFSVADYKALFTREIRQKVRELCAPDYEIYESLRPPSARTRAIPQTVKRAGGDHSAR